MTPEDAFKNSCESITGPITKTISKQGIYKVRARDACAARAACSIQFDRICEAVAVVDCILTSRCGCWLQVYEMMNAADKAKFEQAYSAAYTPAKDVLAEIYDEVRR